MLSSLETAGTRQLLILLMNFTNVIFRLNYFGLCIETPGSSLHSTSMSPRQSHSPDTPGVRHGLERDFTALAKPKLLKSTLITPPKSVQHTYHRTGCDNIALTQQMGAVGESCTLLRWQMRN